jgi:predicted chitinase
MTSVGGSSGSRGAGGASGAGRTGGARETSGPGKGAESAKNNPGSANKSAEAKASVGASPAAAGGKKAGTGALGALQGDTFQAAAAGRSPQALGTAPGATAVATPAAQQKSYPPSVTQQQVDDAKKELPDATLSRSAAQQTPEVVAQNKQVQAALNELGYVADKHVTGTFGSITEGAIKSFQYEKGMTVTGTYDAATREAMAQALAEKREAKAQGVSPPVATLPDKYTPVTDAQLAAIMPNSTAALREKYLEPLNKAMEEFNISTPERQAAFLAQISKETADLQYMSEIQPNPDHGNYFGRGMMQLTHQSNYEKAGQALGVDLTTDPSVVATDPELAARTAGWFFNDKGLNELADQGRIGRVTLRVNGGYNGIDDRLSAYDRALKELRPQEGVANL